MTPHKTDLLFPVEVYGRIFEFVPCRRDILSLCLVSWTFYQEAERVLYGSVDLSDNHRLIMTWFEKIANNARLAALVHTISFGFVYAQIPTQVYSWLETIRDGLNALVNLKELNMFKTSNKFIPGDYAWIIANHSFRLRAFRNGMFDLQPTLSFLKSQSDLTVWQQCNATQCEFPDEILPCLTDVTLAPWILPNLVSRPLTRITTKIELKDADAERQFIEMLGIYGQKITSLELERHIVEGCLTIHEFIRSLAAKIPLLERLILLTHGQLETGSTSCEVATSVSEFSKLNTFSLLPNRALNTDSLYMDVLSSKRRTKAASQFFRASTSLNRVALPTVKWSLAWYARSYNHSMHGDSVIKLTL